MTCSYTPYFTGILFTPFTEADMVFAELTGAFIVILSILYIYYKFVIFSFWRTRGAFYVEPVVPTGNITALITGKKQVGEYLDEILICTI